MEPAPCSHKDQPYGATPREGQGSPRQMCRVKSPAASDSRESVCSQSCGSSPRGALAEPELVGHSHGDAGQNGMKNVVEGVDLEKLSSFPEVRFER